ncbi:thioredoxin family protein [bacterium]|nr:thioredoxin family protein [bacterium]
MVLLESLQVPLGSLAHDFSLPGIDGKNHSLSDLKGEKAVVIIFMCNHCPYVQTVIQKFISLQQEFRDKGVVFVGINANESANYPEDSFEKMSEYADKWGLNFAYLRDDSQEVAKKYKAQCTPDIFVYDKDLKLAYHGKAEGELEDALTSLVAGKKPSEKQNPSMGCSIKWKI